MVYIIIISIVNLQVEELNENIYCTLMTLSYRGPFFRIPEKYFCRKVKEINAHISYIISVTSE